MTPMTPSVLSVIHLLATGALPVAGATSVSPTVVGNDWRFSRLPQPTRSHGLSLAPTVSSGSADAWSIWAYYESANCTDAPPVMVIDDSGCSNESPYEDKGCLYLGNSSSSSAESEDPLLSTKAQCVMDLTTALDELYEDQAYIRVDYYNDSGCSNFTVANVFVADGICHTMRSVNSDTGEYGIFGKIAKVWDNGTASITWFDNVNDCSSPADNDFTLTYSKEQQSSGECQMSSFGSSTIAYSSAGKDDGGLSTGAIVGIVVGCIAFLALVAGLVLWCHQRSRHNGGTETTGMRMDGDSDASVQAPGTSAHHANPYQSAA